jgi:outer membrane usher protein FimD/PapC
VAVKQAPAGTLFSVKWLTIDVGDKEKADYLIDTTETEQGGSGNLDFTLSPDGKFMVGTYRVEIYVNGELDQLKIYSIVAGN